MTLPGERAGKMHLEITKTSKTGFDGLGCADNRTNDLVCRLVPKRLSVVLFRWFLNIRKD